MIFINPFLQAAAAENVFFADDFVTLGAWPGVLGSEGYAVPGASGWSHYLSTPSWISGLTLSGGTVFSGALLNGPYIPVTSTPSNYIVYSVGGVTRFLNFTVAAGQGQRFVSIYIPQSNNNRNLNIKLQTQAGSDLSAERQYTQGPAGVAPASTQVQAGVWARFKISPGALRLSLRHVGDNPHFAAILWD